MSASDQPIVTERRRLWLAEYGIYANSGCTTSATFIQRKDNIGIEFLEVRDDDPDIGSLVESVVNVIDTLAYARDQIIQGKQMNVAHCLSECEHGLRDAMRSSR